MWHVPKRFKEKIDTPELFGTNLLDDEMISVKTGLPLAVVQDLRTKSVNEE